MAQYNSNKKNGIISKYEASAQRYADQIQKELNNELYAFAEKDELEVNAFLIGGGVLGVIIAIKMMSFWGLVIGAFIGIAVWIGINKYVIAKINYNNGLKSQQLIDEAQKKVDAAYNNSYQNAQLEIQKYDSDVDAYYKKVAANSKNISPMVVHTIKMFQKLIAYSDARAAAHIRYVEAELVFTVSNTGIEYSYPGEYKVTLENFVFVYERFRDLSYDYECEGLAQAITRLTLSEMKKLYPPNSMSIKVAHNDACVSLLYKGANKRFVPAKNIV